MNLSDEMVRWLASGERGVSSNTIFTHLTAVNAMGRWPHMSHPLDPDDLTRCVKLLEMCPELRIAFPQMVDLSPQWAALVSCWDELVSILDREVQGWRSGKRGSAPKTYAKMKELGC